MALLDVSGYSTLSGFGRQMFGSNRTQLFDRPNHFTFGLKSPEFAVPVGVDVSTLRFLFLNSLLVLNIKSLSFRLNHLCIWLVLQPHLILGCHNNFF